nr:hypothetical protein [Candidatus Dojkabacteria bacterium]
GVSGADPHIVRNDYYTKQPGYDKAAFEQEGDNMVSEFMWYNLTNPDIRGVTIQGELFSLDAAHELLRRYHYHHVKEALMTDMPELTIDMQTLNEYEFDYGKKEKLINKISTINTNSPVPAEIPIEIIDLFLDHSRGGKAGLEPFPPSGTATRPGLDVYLQTNYGWPVGKQVNTIKDLISLYVDDNPAIVTPEALELRSMLDNELYGIALNARGDKYEIYKAKTFKIGTETRGVKNLFHNPKAHGNPYATTIAGIDGSEKLAKRFLNKNTAELDGYIEAVEDGLKFSNEFVRRLAEISQYERMSYFRKTFWGDFKLWTQRLGNIAMLGSLIGAGLTGAPVFAALILGTMAVRIPAVLWMSKVESTYANRRVNALQLLDEFSGKMSMYKEIMGKPVSRLDKFMLNTAQSSNESKMEDLAKAGTPEGTYPSGDLAFKFANVVFGEKGLVGKMAGG